MCPGTLRIWRGRANPGPSCGDHRLLSSLGAEFLPQLADGDLWVSEDEVESFAVECALLLANCAVIAVASGYEEDYIQFRLTNMIDAAHRAREAGGGVVV